MILKVHVHLVRFEEGRDDACLPLLDGTQQRQILLAGIPHAVAATERPAALPPREAGQKRAAGTSCFAPNAAPSANGKSGRTIVSTSGRPGRMGARTCVPCGCRAARPSEAMARTQKMRAALESRLGENKLGK